MNDSFRSEVSRNPQPYGLMLESSEFFSDVSDTAIRE